MVRQTLAMSIVILAVLTDKNESFADFLKFLLIVLIAYTVHSSAIIAFPIWFLKRVRCTNNSIALFLGLIVVAYVMKDTLSGVLLQFAGEISEKYYEMYGKLQEQVVGTRLYFMVLASVLLGMFLKRFWKDKWNEFCFVCLCVMLIIFPSVQSGGAIMRIYYYFYIFLMIYVPNLISALDKKKDGRIKTVIIIMYVIVGTLYFHSRLLENDFHIVPYEVFWNS